MVCLVCGARRAHQEPMLSLKARNCGSLIAESGNPTLQAVAALKARMDGEPASLTFLILPIFIGVNELVTNEILIRRTTLIDQAVDLPARCLSVAGWTCIRVVARRLKLIAQDRKSTRLNSSTVAI